MMHGQTQIKFSCVQFSQQSHLSVGYSYAIRQRGCQVCFSTNFGTEIVGDIAFIPYKIPDSRTAQRYLNFATNILPVMLVEVPLSVRQVLWLQYNGSEAYCG